MFRIDKSTGTTELLRLRNHRQRQGGFPGRFRAIDFNHSTTGQATNTECNIEAERPGGDSLNVFTDIGISQAHDRSFAKLPLYLSQRSGQGFFFVVVHMWDSP